MRLKRLSQRNWSSESDFSARTQRKKKKIETIPPWEYLSALRLMLAL